METNHIQLLLKSWEELYGESSPEMLSRFLEEIDTLKKSRKFEPLEPEWYKDAIVYSVYVDLFNGTFKGLTDKLDYLQDLGVNCLWLLPILDSPMRDAGFDIRNYRKIRPELSGLPLAAPDADHEAVFVKFLNEAHRRSIKVIFDIATNHTSDQHPWFTEARKSKDNPFREFYIWNKDDQKFLDARIIFKGIETSNWEKDGDEYYFHRFFNFQPDLNFRNPKVLLEMCRNMLYWLERGVDGFRADAIPYIWKEDGTTCENLPHTHFVVKFFRTVLEIARPNTLLLAEACQKPHEVVRYFGNGDECNAGYHFPLMPQIFKTVALQSSTPVIHTLSTAVTPPIPDNAQWFTFLRCHDELSLELVYVTEEDRKYIHESYCKKPEWDFRLGQGISARLSELMDRDPRKISLIMSIMLSLPGTPVIYYGDEFGKFNDEDYYKEMIKVAGKDDSRFLVRGRIDWNRVEKDLSDPESYASKVFLEVKKMLNVRKRFPLFGKGRIQWQEVVDQEGKKADEVLAYIRSFQCERILAIHNLSGEEKVVQLPFPQMKEYEFGLLGHKLIHDPLNDRITIPPYYFYWILL